MLRPFSYYIALFDSFYRSGALVFGGGHVVLPLLEGEFVQNGMMTKEQFLAGYGLTQAVPGPLFTFASYIGAVLNGTPGPYSQQSLSFFLPFACYRCFTILGQCKKDILHTRCTTWSQRRSCRHFTSSVLRSDLDEYNYEFCRFCLCFSSILLTSFLENTTLGHRYNRPSADIFYPL